MEEIGFYQFYRRLCQGRLFQPLDGQIDLSYRCNFNCIHCYCKGLEDSEEELTTAQWRTILDEIRREGCVYLTLTGGEPLIRDDFLELYAYARNRGFIITILTNGFFLRGKILDYLAKSPPFFIEVSLNGISRNTYETITGVAGSFARVLENIKKIKQKGLPLLIKSVCLKQNKDEIPRIKLFADKLLGKTKQKHYFRYGTFISPRLNRDPAPVEFRLSFEELKDLALQDQDIWQEYSRHLCSDALRLRRNRNFLYQCNAWGKVFFISPYGRLKFCNFSQKFSVDLKRKSFRTVFSNAFPKLLKQRFKSRSKCRSCNLRPVCYYCPARAYLETGNEEGPVEYFCDFAKKTSQYPRRILTEK